MRNIKNPSELLPDRRQKCPPSGHFLTRFTCRFESLTTTKGQKLSAEVNVLFLGVSTTIEGFNEPRQAGVRGYISTATKAIAPVRAKLKSLVDCYKLVRGYISTVKTIVTQGHL